MPTLWLTWLRDEHFPLTSQVVSYRASHGPRMVSVLPDMRHSHSAGWNPPDSYAFAEAIVREGRPWLRQVAQEQEQDTALAEFDSSRSIRGAVLFATIDDGFTGRRHWVETPAQVETDGGRVRLSAPLPAGTRAWFFNLHAGDLTGSSEFAELAR
jgi:hypothetical protein